MLKAVAWGWLLGLLALVILFAPKGFWTVIGVSLAAGVVIGVGLAITIWAILTVTNA